jgi:hypothetical protein
MKTFLGVCLLAFSSATWADTFTQGLEVQCDQYQFRINDFDLTNGEPSKRQSVGTKIVHDHDLHRVSCVVNNHNI